MVWIKFLYHDSAAKIAETMPETVCRLRGVQIYSRSCEPSVHPRRRLTFILHTTAFPHDIVSISPFLSVLGQADFV